MRERDMNSDIYLKSVWYVSGQIRIITVLFSQAQNPSIYYWPRISVRKSLFLVTLSEGIGKSQKLMMSRRRIWSSLDAKQNVFYFILLFSECILFFYYYFLFFFNLLWILSYIEMKQPWVYMCSPSRSPLPPPSPPAPSRSSQCTRSERLSHASNLGWWSVSP